MCSSDLRGGGGGLGPPRQLLRPTAIREREREKKNRENEQEVDMTESEREARQERVERVERGEGGIKENKRQSERKGDVERGERR